MDYLAQTKTSKELIIHTGPHERHSSLFVWHTIYVTGSDKSKPFCK